ncbi:MAG: TonB-dependent receptor [Chitinophagaceae bacterium]|nr:TonB-dependent receptor [Chitinophagaceae bacterium]
MHRFIYLFVVCMLHLSTVAWAQKTAGCSFEIDGTLLDLSTGEPLEGASVYLQEQSLHSLCDEDGHFAFRNLCKGSYTLSFFHVGSIKKDTVISTEQRKTKITLSVPRDTSHLEELIVTGNLHDTLTPHASHASLTGINLDLAKSTSLGEGLKSLPGVYAQQSGVNTYKPVIQGLSGNRILIFNNGVRQEGQQWGTDHAPEIDPLVADEIQVIKGAESVRYGSDALGGVILIKPASLIDKGLKTEVYLSGTSVNRGGAASAKVDWAPSFIRKFSMRVQGSIKQGGNYKTPRYYLNNTGIREYNFSLAARKEFRRLSIDFYYSQFNTETGIFAGSHIGNLTDVKRALETDEPLTPQSFSYDIGKPYQHIEHELAKGELTYKLGRGQRLSFEVTRQYNYRAEYDNHRSANDAPGLEFKITTHTATLYWKHRISSRIKGDVGVNGLYQENTVGGRIFIPNFINSTVGVYWMEKLKLDRWNWEAGIRYDVRNLKAYFNKSGVITDSSYQYHNYSASIGGSYAITTHQQWNFLLSRAFRSPAVNELFSHGLHHGVAAIENGDAKLVPEVAYNVSTSYCLEQSNLRAELNVYANYIENYIYLHPSQELELTVYGAFPSFQYSQTNALLIGGDLSLRYDVLKKVQLACKVSSLSGEDLSNGSPLIYMPPTRIEPSVSYLFKNTGLLHEPTLSLTSTLMFKKQNAPTDGDYSPPPKGYALLGLQASTKVKAGQSWITTGLKVNNMLNTVYRDYLDRFRYYHDAPGIGVQLFVKIPLTIID